MPLYTIDSSSSLIQLYKASFNYTKNSGYNKVSRKLGEFTIDSTSEFYI